MPLTDGTKFAGFTIVRLLGSGGMGEVYLVEHRSLPRRDALKVLRADVSADREYRARFSRAADTASTLYHPHILGVHDRGEHKGRLWISMDYIEGDDAARLLARRFPNGMPLDHVVRIVTAAASALDHAHKRHLLHRDVKPANIMLAHLDDERPLRILLTDFGIARTVDYISGLTSTNATVDTVAYSAPEKLLGEQLDGRADEYALAATAYHLLTGSQLYPHSNPDVVVGRHLSTPPPALADARPDLAALDPVFASALAKQPENRFQRCTDFALALAERGATPGAASTAPAVGPAPFTPKAAAATEPIAHRSEPPHRHRHAMKRSAMASGRAPATPDAAPTEPIAQTPAPRHHRDVSSSAPAGGPAPATPEAAPTEPIVQTPPARQHRHDLRSGRQRWLLPAAAVMVVMLVIAAAFLLWQPWKQAGTTSQMAQSSSPAAAPVAQPPQTPAGTPTSTPDNSALTTSFNQVATGLSGDVGVAVFGGQQPVSFGPWQTGAAWSTIKVPLSIAALRVNSQEAQQFMVRAITQSDNAAADQLWAMLGPPQDAAVAVQRILAEGGDSQTTVQSKQVLPPYSAYGQTQWSQQLQARFAFALPCLAAADGVLDQMHNLGSGQQWGLATIDGVAAKGGWGPEGGAGYLVRQIALVNNKSGAFGVALAARPADGSFDTGVAMINKLGNWVRQHLDEFPAGRCQG